MHVSIFFTAPGRFGNPPARDPIQLNLSRFAKPAYNDIIPPRDSPIIARCSASAIGTVGSVNERNQVRDERFGETQIVRATPRRRYNRDIVAASDLIRVDIAHYHNHRLDLVTGNEIIHYLRYPSQICPCIFISPTTVLKVYNRVPCNIGFVPRRCIDRCPLL